MSIPDAILSADNLRVALGGVPVLDIDSFYLKEKEILTIVGPNGSGKTTLLLALACLVKPVSGQISYRGELLGSHDAAFRFRRRISMVFQEPLLFDTTVYKNVASGLRIRGLSRDELQKRAAKYLKMFRIEHLADRSARKLSGGESQRTGLARAFVIEPEIIFLDEPFSSLDPPTRHDLIHDLHEVVRETGTTTVLVTHVEFEALNLAERIIVMNGGRIIQTGSPSTVMKNPLNEFVAKLVGMETILQGRVLVSRSGLLAVSVSGKEVHALGQSKSDEEVICCIRPENVDIKTTVSESDQNVFAGRITNILSIGPLLKLNLDCGFPLVSFVTREAFSNLGLTEGKEVYASFKPESVHVISNGRSAGVPPATVPSD